MTLADQLNEWLGQIYDVTDDIYKSLISNPKGIPEAIIVDPADINQGALANLAEYYRQLSNNLVDNMDYNNASGFILDIFNNKAFQIPRIESETDVNHKDRVKDFIIGKKYSSGAIIYAMRQFSSVEPVIQPGDTTQAFADHTYADRYSSFVLDFPNTKWDGYRITPAIGRQSEDGFFFTLILKDTSMSDLQRVFSYLDVYVAGGIDYQLILT